MPKREELNPYDDPGLREAFRRGWNAWARGKPRPTQQLRGAGEKAAAWIKGYEAAESQEVR